MKAVVSFLITSPLFVLACSNQVSDEFKREDHFIAGSDGVKLFVREVVPKEKKFEYPLLLIHGGGPGALASFDLPVEHGSLAAGLADRGFKIYLMNIRGWEQSTLPEYDFSDSSLVVGSHQEAVRDISSVVDWIIQKEEAGKVSLFGWATGGHWAASYTTREPEKVSHLISLNSLYGVNVPWAMREYFADPADSNRFAKRDFFRESRRESLTGAWTRTIPGDDKTRWRDPAVEEAYKRVAASFGNDTTVMRVPGGYREESFYMSLGKKYWDGKDIRVPALIMRTELDFWSRPGDLTAIEKDLINSPKVKVMTIPGTHYVFLDRPERGRDRMIEEITDFCFDADPARSR